MLHRRAFVVGVAIMVASQAPAENASADIYTEAIGWFIEVVGRLPGSVRAIFTTLRKIKFNLELLLSTKELLLDVRRKLTDPYPVNTLQTKLATWLTHYDKWVSEKPRPGESDQDFAARKERERAALEQEWKQVRDEAAAALVIAETVGNELNSIKPDAIPVPEWRAYKDLLSNEKELARFLNTDMPTDPDSIEKLREAAEQLKQVVQIIDENQAQLDNAIHQKPG
jgi:transcription termination factor NusB